MSRYLMVSGKSPIRLRRSQATCMFPEWVQLLTAIDSIGSFRGSAFAAAIPEPSSIVLIGISMSVMLMLACAGFSSVSGRSGDVGVGRQGCPYRHGYALIHQPRGSDDSLDIPQTLSICPGAYRAVSGGLTQWHDEKKVCKYSAIFARNSPSLHHSRARGDKGSSGARAGQGPPGAMAWQPPVGT